MKRLIVFLSLLVMLLPITIFATGKQETPADSEKEKTEETVIYISYKSGDATRKGLMAEIFNEFNTMYDGTYEIRPLESGSMVHDDLLKVKLATGDFPDIWEVIDLNNYLKADVAAEIPEEILDLLKYTPEVNGKHYNAPIEMMALGVFYNKGIFSDLGLEIPQSYDEFLSVCSKIKDNGITPLAFGGKDAWHTLFIFACLVQNEILAYNPKFTFDLNEGKTRWDDPESIKVHQMYQDLFNNGYADKKGALSTPDAQIPSLIASRKCAMVIEGPWMVTPILEADPDLDLGFFPLPALDPAKTQIPAQDLDSGFGLSTECLEDPMRREAAITFIKFFYGEGIYEKNISTMNSFSTTKRPVSIERVEATMELASALNKYPSAPYYSRYLGPGELPAGWWQYSWKIHQDLVAGAVSPEEAASSLQTYYEECLANTQ